MECEFCKNIFISVSSLNHHKKTAKFCLKIRNKVNDNFICEFCNKILTSNHWLKIHKEKCCKNLNYILEKNENLSIQNLDLLKIQEKLEIQIVDLKQNQEKYEKQIKDLQDKLENIAIKAVSKPTSITTNNNNNSRVNQIINNLTPITSQHIADNAQFLTLDHIKDGACGYAKYALEYPLKDKVLCVDYARRKIKYKDEEGNLVDDPEMTKLCKKFFKAIESHNNNLLNSYNTSILERMLDMNNDGNNEMTEEEGQKCMEIGNILLEEMMKVKNLKTDIEDIKKGNKPVMYHDFVKDVCSKSVC
jgi:hypothetical protein